MGKLLKSAVSNAENNFKQEKDSLYIKEIYITKAQTLKRSVPISRGRVHPILKRNAHAKIYLSVREDIKEGKKAEGKTESKQTVTPTTKKAAKTASARTTKTTKTTKAKA